MFKVGIITAKGDIKGEVFNTKDDAESYILNYLEREPLRQARIKNLDTNEEERII